MQQQQQPGLCYRDVNLRNSPTATHSSQHWVVVCDIYGNVLVESGGVCHNYAFSMFMKSLVSLS
jgi:hypothetical protein